MNPPRLAKRLLRSFLREDLIEEVSGDLDEKFERSIKRESIWKARIGYWVQVIQYVRPFAIRKSRSTTLDHTGMLQNYFKIAWRAMVRQKMYSSIKIGGFALGIAACLLIALFIRQELTYDQHYVNGDRIYRVIRLSLVRGEPRTGVYFPLPMAKVLKEDYPEVEEAGHYRSWDYSGPGSAEIRRSDRQENVHEEGFLHFSQELSDILELQFVAGNPKTAFNELNAVVITRSKAEKHFPGEDALGKLLIINNDEARPWKITGIVEDFPVTSHLRSNFMLSLYEREFWQGEGSDWRASNYFDYVRLREGTDLNELENKLLSISKKYYLPATQNNDADAAEIAWVNSLRFKLQPVGDIYLDEAKVGDNLAHGDIRYIWLFGSIAVFILVMASINFINLSTARSANRAKEVGLRKVAGSLRGSLIGQFLTESLVFSVCSFVLGVLAVWLVLPSFNQLLSKSLSIPWQEWWVAPLLAGGAVVVGLVAGLYPAFYLSSFRPAQVLKGNLSRGSKHSVMRGSLVVFQFTVSIVLIIATVIVGRQMDYILNTRVGFNKDQVMLIQGTHTLESKIVPFKEELIQLSDVSSASISGFLPVDWGKRNGGNFWKEGKKDIDKPVNGQRWSVDYDYAKTLGLEFLQGRDFSRDLPSDAQAIIINRTLANGLAMPDPIGQRITNGWGTWTIIGVIEDFNFESLRRKVEPLSLVLGESNPTVSVKVVNTAEMQKTILAIEGIWRRFSPNQPLRFSFLDDSYARMYDDVERTRSLFRSFAILAIAVACLGLFALSAFMTQQRSKEISIRLILGASVQRIVSMLTNNFVRLILIALVIAVPIAWYIMDTWLEDYAYRIEITWDVFAVSGAAALLIAFLTVGSQAVRAALMNPAVNLRSE